MNEAQTATDWNSPLKKKTSRNPAWEFQDLIGPEWHMTWKGNANLTIAHIADNAEALAAAGHAKFAFIGAVTAFFVAAFTALDIFFPSHLISEALLLPRCVRGISPVVLPDLAADLSPSR